MKRYIFKRLLLLIPIVLGITFLSFAMMRIAGSDAILQQVDATGIALSQEVIDARREELGLNQPFLIQYVRWLRGFLTGDLGVSYISGNDVFSHFCFQTARHFIPDGVVNASYSDHFTSSWDFGSCQTK